MSVMAIFHRNRTLPDLRTTISTTQIPDQHFESLLTECCGLLLTYKSNVGPCVVGILAMLAHDSK